MSKINKLSRRDALKGATLTAGAIGIVAATIAPSAVIAANSEEMQGSFGEVHSFSRGKIKVHTYVSPPQAVNVTAHVLELGDELLVVDGTFLPETAKELSALIQGTGKSVAKAILSHEHPDHWSGIGMVEGVNYQTLPAILEDVKEEAGENLPQNLTGDLEIADMEIGGVKVELRNFENLEAKNAIVVVLPEERLAVVQDLVYNGVFFAPGYDRKAWIKTLEDLRDDPAFDTLLVGHGLPTTRAELDVAIQYLTVFDAAFEAEGATPETVMETMKSTYPGFAGEFLLGLIAEYWPS